MSNFFVDQLFGGAMGIAFPLAIIAGLVSFLSPCVLPLVPGYLTYAAGFSQSRGRVFLGSSLFVLGFTVLYLSYGVLFGSIGATFAEHSDVLTQILGVFTIAMGLIFYGLFPMSPTIRPTMSTTGGIIGAPVLGFLFGLGWTPCIGPALATVQTLSFNSGTALRGALLSFGYCIGLGAPFIFTGLYFDKSKKLRSFLVSHGNTISKIGGGLLIVIGLLQLFGLWSNLMITLRSLLADFVPVI